MWDAQQTIQIGRCKHRAATKEAMSRKLVWIEQQRFRGFGCSECGWRFKPSGVPTATSFDELMRMLELRRDKEFTSHVCADHPSPRVPPR